MTAIDHLGPQFDYQTGHRPPDPEYGASMDNPDTMFPDYHKMPGVYRTYSSDLRVDQESHRALTAARGNPEADIPATAPGSIPVTG